MVLNCSTVPAKRLREERDNKHRQIRQRTAFTGEIISLSLGLAQGLEIFSDTAVGGGHAIGVPAGHGFAPELAAGALKNQSARRDVPQFDAVFEIGVEAA